MHAEVEGCECIQAWSLKHEGLLEPGWMGKRPISIWESTFYVDHREWHRRAEPLSIERYTPRFPPPGLMLGIDYVGFGIVWSEGRTLCAAEFLAISSSRMVGSNRGKQWWLQCPKCRRRTCALFLKYCRLACRQCQGLVYQSEKLTRKERASNRSWKSLLTGGTR